ncbi:trypsin-like peptidase domain-containing protein [Streptomyces benahoarensis]|uniref:trypsin-like peptidase domain-containing protein n=1 Tax=Streptomyces benahoarensis TaxID=2595054 RepID=UPI002551CD42|nr:trypsin-like peptidase domain-containing protein [Streptomyces benahoarensis]
MVQILTERSAGAPWRGSGYRVSDGAVLTAAHVVSDAASVRLRFVTEDGGTAELPGEPVWTDTGIDVAVLRIVDGTGLPGGPSVPPVRFARITAPVACEALGFPRFRLRRDPAATERAGSRYRDTHHARGSATPLSYLRAGLLEITVDGPGHDPDHSPWEGMSGAAVWSDGCVIGVVSEHPEGDGPGRLAASRVERWYPLPEDRRDALHGLIGLPAGADALTALPTAAEADAPEPDDPPEVRAAAARLVRDLDQQWRKEQEQRKVHHPFPLNVRFRCTPARDLFDHWENIREDPSATTAAPLPLDGGVTQIAAVHASVPSGRLVVLGEAGSGKSVLTLRFVLDRLATRKPGAPVPVLFGLGSWDPSTVSLRDWMSGQLVRDHPFLATPDGHGGTLAGALVDARRILPVLDGLDELAEGLRPRALGVLRGTTLPLLLTSRPDEYRAAVEGTGVLGKAAVVELCPLTVDDYGSYLRRAAGPPAGGDPDKHGWKPVLDKLREEPPAPGAAHLGAVLTTPLMVSLARAVYSDTPGRNPAELLDTARFKGPAALRAHLLAAFLPAVYDRAPDDRAAETGRRWKPERARKWLGHLAADLHARGTRDLAWWEVGLTVSRATRMRVIGFLAALAFGLTTGIGNLPVDLVATAYGPGFASARGLLVGLLHGAVVGLVFGMVYGRLARGTPVTPSHLRIRLFGGGREWSAPFGRRFLLGVAFGVPTGLALVLADRCVVAPLGFDDGLDGGPLGAVLLPLQLGLGAGLVLGVMTRVEVPLATDTAVSAADLLHTNRRNVVVHMLVWLLVFGIPGGFAAGLSQGPVRGVLAGLVFGLEGAFGGGLGYGLSFTAWGQWVALARIWLPLTGRAPWALIAFLDDARRRGVLRRAGAVYQFRHASLQDHLAHDFREQHPSRAPVPEPPATGQAS